MTAVECTNTANSCLKVAVPPSAALNTAKRMPVTISHMIGAITSVDPAVMRPMYEAIFCIDGPLRLRDLPSRRPRLLDLLVEEGRLADLCRVEHAEADGRDEQHERHHPEPARPGHDVGIGLPGGGQDAPETGRQAQPGGLGRGRRGGRRFTHGSGLVLEKLRRPAGAGHRAAAGEAYNSPSLDDFRARGVPDRHPVDVGQTLACSGGDSAWRERGQPDAVARELPTSRESDAAAIRVADRLGVEIGHLTENHAFGWAACRPPSGTGCGLLASD